MRTPDRVRSPYLNCWTTVITDFMEDVGILSECDTSQWDPAPLACYFLAQRYRKFDSTLVL
jgi:hypothetical protein